MTESKPAFFPSVSPTLQSPAAYRLTVWIYEKDGKWHAEAPELDGMKAEGDAATTTYTKLSGMIGQLRNNRGKPKPLVLKPLAKDTKPPAGAYVRTLCVS